MKIEVGAQPTVLIFQTSGQDVIAEYLKFNGFEVIETTEADVIQKIKETEYFDKAIEDGTSARAAQRDADIAGIIEGGIELVGDRILLGIGKIPQIQQISNRVVSSAMVKAFKDKVGKEAVKKIASKHLESVGGATLKGFSTIL